MRTPTPPQVQFRRRDLLARQPQARYRRRGNLRFIEVDRASEGRAGKAQAAWRLRRKTEAHVRDEGRASELALEAQYLRHVLERADQLARGHLGSDWRVIDR